MELTEDEYDRAVMDAERVTLVNDIYGKLGGADWDVPWNLAEENVALWHGVTCESVATISLVDVAAADVSVAPAGRRSHEGGGREASNNGAVAAAATAAVSSAASTAAAAGVDIMKVRVILARLRHQLDLADESSPDESRSTKRRHLGRGGDGRDTRACLSQPCNHGSAMNDRGMFSVWQGGRQVGKLVGVRGSDRIQIVLCDMLTSFKADDANDSAGSLDDENENETKAGTSRGAGVGKDGGDGGGGEAGWGGIKATEDLHIMVGVGQSGIAVGGAGHLLRQCVIRKEQISRIDVRDGQVQELDLSSNGLHGEVDDVNWFAFVRLRKLNLVGNPRTLTGGIALERFTEGYVAVRTASDNLDLFLMIGNARLLVGDIPVREPGDHGYPYAWMDEPALVQVRSLNIVD